MSKKPIKEVLTDLQEDTMKYRALQQKQNETFARSVCIEDALDASERGIERALFVAHQALEGHGYTFNSEAKHWFNTVLDVLEQTKVDIKRSKE